jgi:ribosome-binding factor A
MSSSKERPRRVRVAQALRDHLSEMLTAGEIHDPRVQKAGLIGVNHVELNRDMSGARIWVSFIIEDQATIDLAMQGLEAAAGFLRGPLGRRMNLKRAPVLRFVHDQSPEFLQRLAQIREEDERGR